MGKNKLIRADIAASQLAEARAGNAEHSRKWLQAEQDLLLVKAERDHLAADNARLREALAPFARFFDFVEAAAARGLNDDETVATCGRYGTASYHAITYGHLRQARAALAAGKE